MGYPSWMNDYLQTNLLSEDRFSDQCLNRSQVMVTVGQLFELISSKIFYKINLLQESPKEWDYYPDLVVWNSSKYPKNDIILESKGTSKNPLLDVNQLKFYQNLEKESTFPFTSPKVYYIFYKYKTNQKLSSLGNVYKIVEYIINNIECAVLLSLADLNILNNVVNKEYSYGNKWCNNDNRRTNYIRYPRSFSELLFTPYKGIIDLLSTSYNFSLSQAYKRVFSPNISLLEYPIFRFPMIIPKSVTRKDGLLKL